MDNVIEESNKKQAGFRMSADAIRLLKQMAKTSGISQAAVLELMIRAAAEKKGMK